MNQRKKKKTKQNKTNTCHTKCNIQFDLNDLLLVVELPTNTFKISKWASTTDFLVKAAKGNEASFNDE